MKWPSPPGEQIIKEIITGTDNICDSVRVEGARDAGETGLCSRAGVAAQQDGVAHCAGSKLQQ